MSSMYRELSSPEYNFSHCTQAAPYTHAHQNRPLFAKRQRGIYMWGVQTHNGPLVFLVPFRKDLARMDGTQQLNEK